MDVIDKVINFYVGISNSIAGPMHMNWFDAILSMTVLSTFAYLVIHNFHKGLYTGR